MARVLLGLVYLLSACLAHGDGDALYKQGAAVYESEPAQAFGLFVQAAEAGNPSAMVGAGHCCETGIGTKVDYAKAIEWYEKAVAHNSLKACEGLSRIYASCDDPEFHDGEEAVKYASVLARKKPRDADALILLAAAHARNIEFDKAVEIISKACGMASINMQSDLRARQKAYFRGTPYPERFTEVWIMNASEKGSVWAMCEIAKLYTNGKHTRPDLEAAVAWYEKAVAARSTEASFMLGVFRLKGIGCLENEEEAVALLHAAAGKGCQNAWFYLGYISSRGLGERYDEEQARQYFQRAGSDVGGSYRGFLEKTLCSSMHRELLALQDPASLYREGLIWGNLSDTSDAQLAKNISSRSYPVHGVAVIHLLAAAERGHYEAKCLLDRMYVRGEPYMRAMYDRTKKMYNETND